MTFRYYDVHVTLDTVSEDGASLSRHIVRMAASSPKDAVGRIEHLLKNTCLIKKHAAHELGGTAALFSTYPTRYELILSSVEGRSTEEVVVLSTEERFTYQHSTGHLKVDMVVVFPTTGPVESRWVRVLPKSDDKRFHEIMMVLRMVSPQRTVATRTCADGRQEEVFGEWILLRKEGERVTVTVGKEVWTLEYHEIGKGEIDMVNSFPVPGDRCARWQRIWSDEDVVAWRTECSIEQKRIRAIMDVISKISPLSVHSLPWKEGDRAAVMFDGDVWILEYQKRYKQLIDMNVFFPVPGSPDAVWMRLRLTQDQAWARMRELEHFAGVNEKKP